MTTIPAPTTAVTPVVLPVSKAVPWLAGAEAACTC
jgi:hypothetical protein